ncbi:MAG: GNAT family N-acetyltransferase [Stappiaceae bacterium]
MINVSVRPVRPDDRDQWDRLYQGYAAFYNVEQTAEMRDRVWSWLHDEREECRGAVAVTDENELVGLAHFRSFARPLMATTGCFLDDLFVSQDKRGLGAADALVASVKAIAEKNGWSVVRWITAENNYRARGLYDRVASQTNWVTYDLKI